MRRYKKLLAVTLAVIAVLGLGLVAASTLGAGEKALPEAMTQRIQMSVDELLTRLTPGTSLHMQMEIFKRHGPAASEIETMSWAMPENAVWEGWVGPVNEDGTFAGYKGIIKDAAGNIVQEVAKIGEEVVYRDVRFGEEMRSPWVPMSAGGYLQAAANLPQRLLDGGWAWVANGSWNGRETVVLEKRVAYEEPFFSRTEGATQGSVTGANIPYTLDLQLKELMIRKEIVLENPILYRAQTWVIDQWGDRTLIEEARWTLIELLSY